MVLFLLHKWNVIWLVCYFKLGTHTHKYMVDALVFSAHKMCAREIQRLVRIHKLSDCNGNKLKLWVIQFQLWAFLTWKCITNGNGSNNCSQQMSKGKEDTETEMAAWLMLQMRCISDKNHYQLFAGCFHMDCHCHVFFIWTQRTDLKKSEKFKFNAVHGMTLKRCIQVYQLMPSFWMPAQCDERDISQIQQMRFNVNFSFDLTAIRVWHDCSNLLTT